jgi:hypothetical protein
MMRTLFLIVALSSLPAWADPPKFSSGGVIFGLQYGPGFWTFDRTFLGGQVGQTFADAYLADLQNTHTVGVRLGYNILGHVSIEANLVATGWNLSDTSRGGGGILTGILAWHPMELIFLNKEKRPLPIDASIYFGAGYGIVGQRRGMDGLTWQWGMTADYWFNRFLGLGIFVRGSFPRWGAMYLDYDNRTAPGNTKLLPMTSGGMFWIPGFELLFRFGE